MSLWPLEAPQSSTPRRRPRRCAQEGFLRSRAGREVGGLARVLRGSLPADPSPAPPPPRHLPLSLSPVSPQLSPPFTLSAPVGSSPSPPAPSRSLTAVSGLDSGGGCFSRRNSVKFNRSRGGELRAASSSTDVRGALPGVSRPWVKEGVRALETCLCCGAA